MLGILLFSLAIAIVYGVYANYSYVDQKMQYFLQWEESMKNTLIMKKHMRTLDKDETKLPYLFEIFTLPIEYIKHILYYYILPSIRSFMNTHLSI
jgi:hypothetical protein